VPGLNSAVISRESACFVFFAAQFRQFGDRRLNEFVAVERQDARQRHAAVPAAA